MLHYDKITLYVLGKQNDRGCVKISPQSLGQRAKCAINILNMYFFVCFVALPVLLHLYSVFRICNIALNSIRLGIKNAPNLLLRV